jgi:hypothetical protein
VSNWGGYTTCFEKIQWPLHIKGFVCFACPTKSRTSYQQIHFAKLDQTHLTMPCGFWWMSMSSHLQTEEGAVLEVIFMRSNRISGLVCFGLRTFFAAVDSSTVIKCDPVFKMCVNDPHSILIQKNWSWQCNTGLRSTTKGVRAYQPPHIAINIAVTWHPKQSHPVVIREILHW